MKEQKEKLMSRSRDIHEEIKEEKNDFATLPIKDELETSISSVEKPRILHHVSDLARIDEESPKKSNSRPGDETTKPLLKLEVAEPRKLGIQSSLSVPINKPSPRRPVKGSFNTSLQIPQSPMKAK
jgi:hypothetical protein